jgi:hypothetical protein
MVVGFTITCATSPYHHRSCRGRDRMVVGLATTCAINVYHHRRRRGGDRMLLYNQCLSYLFGEFESR